MALNDYFGLDMKFMGQELSGGGEDPTPPTPITPFDPTPYLPFVVDAMDVNNLRHLPDGAPAPADDNAIDALDPPTEGQKVYAVRNLGTAGGWFVLQEGDYDRYATYSGTGLTTDASRVAEFALPMGDASLDLLGVYLGSVGGGSAGSGGFNTNLDVSIDQRSPEVVEWWLGYSNDMTHEDRGKGDYGEVAIVAVITTGDTYPPSEETWGPFPPVAPPYDGYPPLADFSVNRDVGKFTRAFAGSTSDIPNYDWATHGPALKAWLDGE